MRIDRDAGIAELPDAPLREEITCAAALGFVVGGLSGFAAGGADGVYWMLLRAVAIPVGALAAAVVAGILFNLIVLPTLARIVPGRRLPDPIYHAAGALCALIAFGGAFTQFTSNWA